MSLLNDMLRDLSSTQKKPDEPEHELLHARAEKDNLLDQSGILKAEPGNLWPSVIVFVVVLAALLVWKRGEIFSDRGNHSSDMVSTTNQPEKLAPTPTYSDEEKISETASGIALENEALSPAPVLDGDKKATELLTERLAALETAITTLATTVQQTQYADVKANSAEATKTNPLLDEDVQRSPYEQSVSIRDPFLQQDHDTEFEALTRSDGVSAGGKETLTGEAHLSISPNTAFLDQRQAELARGLLAQNQTDDAIVELQQFIATAEAPRESTLLLLEIFSAQGNVAALKNLLRQAIFLSEIDQQFYRAKVAIIEQREEEAVELLEVYLKEAEQHENYRALLAGLYQRTEKYAEAATSYHRLLNNFGEKPAYWLGFALAQDSLNQTQTAKQAYLRLANYSGLQPEVRSYIQQRLASLQ
jgi:MSHA biogenesis protein MshN